MASILPRTLDLTEESGQRYDHMGAVGELGDLLHERDDSDLDEKKGSDLRNVKEKEPTGPPTGKGKIHMEQCF